LIALVEDSMGCSGTAESPEAHLQFFSYNNDEKQYPNLLVPLVT
jgi:hypothetical protein